MFPWTFARDMERDPFWTERRVYFIFPLSCADKSGYPNWFIVSDQTQIIENEMKSYPWLLISICLVMLGMGCTSISQPADEAYQNEKKPNSATVYQKRSKRWGGDYVTVSLAEIHEIDGEHVPSFDDSPIYVEPGLRQVIFRFQMSSSPGINLHSQAEVLFKPNTYYRIWTWLKRGPEYHIEFRLYEEERVIYTDIIPFSEHYVKRDEPDTA